MPDKNTQLNQSDFYDAFKCIPVRRGLPFSGPVSLPVKRRRELNTQDGCEYPAEENESTQTCRLFMEQWYLVDSELDILLKHTNTPTKETEVVTDTDSDCIVDKKQYNIEEKPTSQTTSKQDRVKELVYSTLAKKKPLKKQHEYIPVSSLDYSLLIQDHNLLPSIPDHQNSIMSSMQYNYTISTPKDTASIQNINNIESEEVQLIDVEDPQQIELLDKPVSSSLENFIQVISNKSVQPNEEVLQSIELSTEEDSSISSEELSKMNISSLVTSYFNNHNMSIKSVLEECQDIGMNICRVYVDNNLIAEVTNVSRNKARLLAGMKALSHFAPKLAERWIEVNKESPYLRLLTNA